MKAALITGFIAAVIITVQYTQILSRDLEIANLKAAVEAHNNATGKLADDSKQANADAAGRVTTVLLQAEKTKRTLPQGTGPVVMNQFMQAVFQ